MHENRIRLLENAGPVGLSLMLVYLKFIHKNLEHKAITEAMAFHIIPKSFIIVVTRIFNEKSEANKFQRILTLS